MASNNESVSAKIPISPHDQNKHEQTAMEMQQKISHDKTMLHMMSKTVDQSSSGAPAAYREPAAITKQRERALQELQKAAASSTGALQEMLRKTCQVIERTTPRSARDEKLQRDALKAMRLYVAARDSGKAPGELPLAFVMAIEFMKANLKVLEEVKNGPKSSMTANGASRQNKGRELRSWTNPELGKFRA